MTWSKMTTRIKIDQEIVRLINEITSSLDGMTRYVLTEWTQGTICGVTPRLDDYTDVLYASFKPLRRFLAYKYGQKVTMFRGEPIEIPCIDRKWLSWTTNHGLAAVFADRKEHHIVKAEVDVNDVVAGIVLHEGEYYIEYLILDRPEYHDYGRLVPVRGQMHVDTSVSRYAKSVIRDAGGEILRTWVHESDDDFEFITFVLPADAVLPGFSFEIIGHYPDGFEP